jgi:hypothetical protein
MLKTPGKKGHHGGMFRVVACVVMVAVPLLGCTPPPKPAFVKPVDRRDPLFAGVRSIGVVTASDVPELELLVPAKGPLEGAKKGAMDGASFMGAFAQGGGGGSPEFLLIVAALASVFAVIGGASGALLAENAAVVQKREDAVRKAIENLRMQEKIRDAFWRAKERVPFFRFVSLDEAGFGASEGYGQGKGLGIDAVQELSVTDFGLTGMTHVQPDLRAYIAIEVRLTRSEDNAVIFRKRLECRSEKNKFAAWAENGGELLQKELDACYGRLAEDVIQEVYKSSPAAEDVSSEMTATVPGPPDRHASD